jgi:hypothetical protein
MATTAVPTAVLEQIAAMRAAKKSGASGSGEGVQGNRMPKLLGLLTEADTKGIVTLQAKTVLEGWTRVHQGQVVADCDPESVSRIVAGRSVKAQGKTLANVPQTDDDARWGQYHVLASKSLKPAPQTRLGGRFYIVSLNNVAGIAKATFDNMLDDIDDADSIFLSALRQAAEENEES